MRIRPPRLRAPGTLVALLSTLLACSADGPMTDPGSSNDPQDLGRAAFQLTIDVATGKVVVSPPRVSGHASEAGTGPSLSLVGGDVIQLHAGDCAFSAVPNNTKRKRCTLQLAIENRLRFSDLLTPATFPKPPAGIDGILVFPFTSAALGLPGGAATPNGDWSNPPANFFNDFAACSTKSSDCYRWERYASPLAAGETTSASTVGFDIDKAAQSVSAYIVVAADLRDAEPRSLVVRGDQNGCGTAAIGGGSSSETVGPLRTGAESINESAGVCSFTLPALLKDVSVVGATLTLHQTDGNPAFFNAGGRVLLDWVDYALPFERDLYSGMTVLQENLGPISVSADPGARSLDVNDAVLGDLVAGRSRSHFRVRWADVDGYLTTFAGVSGEDTDPTLTIRYRPR
ncbi:MAG TPA: hypothetical protein VJQ44_06380 [Gemmatimonadales bacterium]|nr:hypothetical protein [Gemmatimonadales bacterium]